LHGGGGGGCGRRPAGGGDRPAPHVRPPDPVLRAHGARHRPPQRPPPLRHTRLRPHDQQRGGHRHAAGLAPARRWDPDPGAGQGRPRAPARARPGHDRRHRPHDPRAAAGAEAPPGAPALEPRLPPPGRAQRRPAHRVDARLRPHQPALAARRAHPRQPRAGRRLGVHRRLHLLPAAARARGRVADDDARPRAVLRSAAGRPPDLPGPLLHRRSPDGARDPPGGHRVRGAGPADRVGPAGARGAQRELGGADRRHPRRLRRRAVRVLDLPVRAPRVLRAARHEDPVRPERRRERAQRPPRARLHRAVRHPGPGRRVRHRLHRRRRRRPRGAPAAGGFARRTPRGALRRQGGHRLHRHGRRRVGR
ncbi:MAG: hypothetical protein AVDCRST_MAG50-1340, partial [uncultured Acidimicrobiales bacterium]